MWFFPLCTLLYLIIWLKINLLIFLKEPSIDEAILTLHLATETHFDFEKKNKKKYHAWSCQNVCDMLTFLLDNIFIRFGTRLYRQEVGSLWALFVLPWLPIYSCFVMRGTLWCLFLMISRLILVTLFYDGSDLKTYEMVGAWSFGCYQAHGGLPVGFLLPSIQFYLYLSP